MEYIKLKWKIFAFLLCFCTMLILVLWLFQTVLLNDMYKLVRKSEMNKAISAVENNIDDEELKVIMLELESEKAILVTPSKDFKEEQRTVENGTREYIPESTSGGIEYENNRAENIKPDNRGKPMQETLTEVREFVRSDGTTMSLTFHAIITPVDATVNTLKLQLYIITAIMIILSTLLALVIAKHVSRPIEDITKGAKELAEGNYNTRFEGTGFLEISELSKTLNTAAEELSKVEGLRRELMANISHDLRTPLSLIYSYSEMMHDFPDEITGEQTQVIMDETKRLTSLVNDVFEISKLETGNQHLNLNSFNLTTRIRDTIERMKALVGSDGFIIEFVGDEEIIVVADEVKIEQVFYNLLINAIHYSGEDKAVVVRQSVADGMVKIEVIDRGDGIAKEDIPYIWDRYYKIDKNHKRAVTGTGLGLSIVRRMMELHEGIYGVESEVGVGSRFWFGVRI